MLMLNGLYADVLSVYTEPEYKGQGLCTKLMNNLVTYGKEKGLDRIEPWPLQPIPAAAIGQLIASDVLAVMMIVVSVSFVRELRRKT